ncbi:hypothetical protein XELAEV_18017523mg [Xenopus laevis]|uniref:SARAH domain-containing protein n=1 Tax=Xenopus laevis TaxID=8355 RepID=A0A974HSY1_XENLA|nr:hypothetical protein XELAEV_18017523mg [Xenopus laevis]
MTWSSNMSSGYSSLEEDSEEFYFTARTSFFKKPSGKAVRGQHDIEKEKDSLSYLSKEETKDKIQLYNAAVTDKLKMTLNSSGIYTGFIKVQMELRRPITHPLYLRLVAGPCLEALGFVLREHETGDVMWEAFSLPELQNFLRILDKEENEQLQSLKRRYTSYRAKLEEALSGVHNPG